MCDFCYGHDPNARTTTTNSTNIEVWPRVVVCNACGLERWAGAGPHSNCGEAGKP